MSSFWISSAWAADAAARASALGLGICGIVPF